MPPTTREDKSILFRITNYSNSDVSYVAEVLLKVIDYLEAQEREGETQE